MNLCEHFYSLQGEGVYSGTPSIFMRFSGCNLKCEWCDTSYALKSSDSIKININDLIKIIEEYNCKNVVITGGEPFLQQDLQRFCKILKKLNYHVTIETNGTIYKEIECDLISISPKFPKYSGVKDGNTLIKTTIFNTLQFIEKLNYQLKFVIKEKEDFKDVTSFINSLAHVNIKNVIIMPEGTNISSQLEKMPWIAKFCIEKGFRLIPRLHTLIWGNERKK